MQFLMNAYGFHSIVKSKNRNSNHLKYGMFGLKEVVVLGIIQYIFSSSIFSLGAFKKKNA